jgi:ketosteroid isomerase-like protein
MVNNTIASQDRTTIEAYMALMQTGSAGLDDLIGLFQDDAVYVEPFTGQPQVHAGKGEIRAFYEQALERDMKAARLTLDRLDLDGERLRAEWTCELPQIKGQMRGFDLLTMRNGRIARLETTVTEMPARKAD